jgi:glycosyltransferase involved in cell wall biosynthesis
VPSEDTRERLAPLLPGLSLLVRPHPESYADTVDRAAPSRPGRPRRVAVIGAIGPHKGAELLLACAKDAAERDLALEFRVIGYSDRDADLLETKKVVISGAYEEQQLPELLRRARCEIAFIPSVWPETFCYTLSAAFRSQIYPVAFDLGAIAERIERLGWGDLIPLEWSAEAVNDHLVGLKPRPFPVDAASRALGMHYQSYRADYYDGLMS